MLKNIPKIVSPELLKTLCEMGHGDEIVIADGNFPAETFGYSKNYLSFLFNKYTGMGFCDYLSRVRITEAMKRLSDEKNESGVTAIAMECGFNSMNTFYRARQKFIARDSSR